MNKLNKDKYYFTDNKFIIEDYDKQKPFASFLPGVAGLNGIPMWAYYTNRGQGIAGYGIHNKDGSIFDFVPANQSYRRTEVFGFRTFIKKEGIVREIFSSYNSKNTKRKMLIEPNSFGFEEENYDLNIRVSVKYFTVTNENYPGLVRKVSIKSLDGSDESIQIADGLMTLWPYGNSNGAIKDVSNLSVAWFDIFNTENDMPFYRNRSTTNDSAEVGKVEAGHFYAAYNNKKDGPMYIVYDPDILFGENTSLTKPDRLEEYDLSQLKDMHQISENKIPCAYAVYEGSIGDELNIISASGKMNHIDELNNYKDVFSMEYFADLEKRAYDIGLELTSAVDGKTAFPMFDAYVKQSFMDNALRGGYPLVFEGANGPIVFHVYSRIHGDMEREYNYFTIEPSYYSQGVGAFRDVNQNRRNDVFFVQDAGLFNVRLFMEFIQMDGQNPLSIKGSKFRVVANDLSDIIKHVKTNSKYIKEILSGDFTPGELLSALDIHDAQLDIDRNTFLKEVLKKCVQLKDGAYGHGYWSDHWTYNMDLVDNYLNVYPDKFDELMFDESFRYFISPVNVLPREDKYVINSEGKVRQYDAIIWDEDKVEKLNLDIHTTNWHKDKEGNIVETNLFVKLLSLVLNKISSLDQSSLGIMMNTDKPGWNDAMNGLPGLFGSGTSETIELKRITQILCKANKVEAKLSMPKELYSFYKAYKDMLEKNLNGDINDLQLFESAQTAKEAFNDAIRLNLSGDNVLADIDEVMDFVKAADNKLRSSIDKAFELGDGVLPSYIYHEAKDYSIIEGKKHPVNGFENVSVSSWNIKTLPLYLEAPARFLKINKDKNLAQNIFSRIKAGGMYDEKLKMYVTSESLENESFEIGRARAFTPGWLERESVFMHMEYKYLLGMVKSGLYEEFFDAVQTALPPFMNAEVYGRSILENSSFIASSRNPNYFNHGRGFVSRLTGTTSEMLSMWLHMMTGTKIFKLENNKLKFELNPILSSDFFDENNQVICTIFGSIKVIYNNAQRKNTFGENRAVVTEYKLKMKNGEEKVLNEVTGTDAIDIRQNRVETIEVTLK